MRRKHQRQAFFITHFLLGAFRREKEKRARVFACLQQKRWSDLLLLLSLACIGVVVVVCSDTPFPSFFLGAAGKTVHSLSIDIGVLIGDGCV